MRLISSLLYEIQACLYFVLRSLKPTSCPQHSVAFYKLLWSEPLNGIWYSASAAVAMSLKAMAGKTFWPSLIMVNGRWEGQVGPSAGEGAGTVGM